nr:hypothetical protein BaRGS_029822 [Batillaria attramentaria]
MASGITVQLDSACGAGGVHDGGGRPVAAEITYSAQSSHCSLGISVNATHALKHGQGGDADGMVVPMAVGLGIAGFIVLVIGFFLCQRCMKSRYGPFLVSVEVRKFSERKSRADGVYHKGRLNTATVPPPLPGPRHSIPANHDQRSDSVIDTDSDFARSSLCVPDTRNARSDETGTLLGNTDTLPNKTGTLLDKANNYLDKMNTSPDRTRTLPDGTGTLPDGTGTLPDRTGTLPDRTGTLPDGTGTLPDGSGTLPDGTGTPPDDPWTAQPNSCLDLTLQSCLDLTL